MGFLKVLRHGSTVEIARYSRDLVRPPKGGRVFIRAPRTEQSKKLLQNIQRARRNIRRQVATAVYFKGRPAFATFTYGENKAWTVEKALKDWKEFTYKIRKEYPDVSLIRVFEKHKKGDLHIHCIIFGLPATLPCIVQNKTGYHNCPASRPCERKLRSMRTIWAHGHVDLAWANKVERAGSYIAKYLTKGEDWRMFGRHLYSANTALHELVKMAKERGVYWDKSTFKDGQGLEAEVEVLRAYAVELGMPRVFDTYWLGQCTYQSITIDKAYQSEVEWAESLMGDT